MSDSSLFVANASNGTTNAIPLPIAEALLQMRPWIIGLHPSLPRQDQGTKAAELTAALFRGQKALKEEA